MSVPERVLYRAWWPLTPAAKTMALHELIAEAEEALPGVAALSRVAPVGRPRWRLAPGRDYPGTGGALEVLLCDVWAHQVPRHVDALEAQRLEPHLWGRAA